MSELSLETIKQCRECKFTGLRLYRPYFANTIYCHDCLIKLGGIPAQSERSEHADNILCDFSYYHPMLCNNYSGVICTDENDIKTWKRQPVRISDLYEPGSVKYQESKDKIEKLF